MRCVYNRLPVYTGDISGVASALYELGGLIVIHDPSGCNSTYNTHDEVRWYQEASRIYISGLKESDAIMGNDGKFIDDIVQVALDQHPNFIALANSPIPYLNATDFSAICKKLEERLDIPAFYIPTNAMHDYTHGIALAFKALASHLSFEDYVPTKKAINILGVTPLDYTPSDTTALFKDIFHDYEVLSIWARDTSLKELQRATSANVNIVVSSSGLRLAQYFERTYHIPYVLGSPIGDFKYKIFKAIEEAISTGKSQNPLLHKEVSDKHIIIGDAIISHSLGNALYTSYKMITPLEESKRIIRTGDLASKDEEEIEQALNGARTIIGDPMYQVLTSTPITPLPHLAFSGRLYLKSMPNILKGGILDEFK